MKMFWKKRKSKDEVLEQAAKWFARLRAEDFSQDEKRQFEAWLNEDISHQTAFREMEDTWKEVGILSPSEVPDVEPMRHRLFPMPRLRLAALTIMIFLVVGVAFFRAQIMECWFYLMGKGQTYVTEIGQQKKITLKDGSILEMNADSVITVRFSKWQRKVELPEGEVFFRVARDTQRPFEVKSHNGMVRVLGTSFNVRSRSGRVSVDVEQGRVQVVTEPERNSGILSRAVVLKANQGVDYNWSGRMDRVRGSCIEDVLAWRKGKIVFRSMRLIEVLRELEHYHRVKLRLEPDFWNKRFTGTFSNSDLNAVLSAIKVAFSLKTKTAPDGSIVLCSDKQ